MALKLFIIFLVLLLFQVIFTGYLIIRYKYESLIEFRPDHHLVSVLVLFWTNVILYSAVFRAITHYHVALCLIAGYISGCVLHRKDIKETYDVWRLNNGKKKN